METLEHFDSSQRLTYEPGRLADPGRLIYRLESETIQMLKPERYCPFCGTIVGGNQIACNKHYEDYKKHKNEPWMKFLKADLEREYNQELWIAEIETKGDEAEMPREYNKITEENLRHIYELREQGLGHVRIAKELNLNAEAVKYHISQRAKKVKSKSGIRESLNV